MRKWLLVLILAFVVPHSYAGDTAAPAFTLTNTAGEEVTLPRSHNGVDVYFFWASWCPYCKALMPHLQSMQIEYGDDINIYALNIRDDEDPKVFMQKAGYDFDVLVDADSTMAAYGVRGTPALFLVDGKGLIRFNLYETIFDRSKTKGMSNKKKAAHAAPFWAARIRQSIDQLLLETKSD